MRMHRAVAPLRARAWIWVLAAAVLLAVAAVVMLLWNTGGGSARDERLTGTRTISVVSPLDAAAGSIELISPLALLMQGAAPDVLAPAALPAARLPQRSGVVPVGRTPDDRRGSQQDSTGPVVQPVTPRPPTGGTDGATTTPPALPPVQVPAPAVPSPEPGGGTGTTPAPGVLDDVPVPGLADAVPVIAVLDTPLVSVGIRADVGSPASATGEPSAPGSLQATVGGLILGRSLSLGGG